MNGPKHYREAEALLWQAESLNARNAEARAEMAALVSAAQVHATLAVAAATALTPGGLASASTREWVRAVNELD